MFGSPETTSGGRALKFYSSVRLDIRRIGRIKEGEVVIGNRTKVTVVKNKIAPPFRKTEFDIIFARGISISGDLVDLGIEHGIVQKSGAWFSYGDVRLGQGRERVCQLLNDTPDLMQEIRAAILAKIEEAAAPKSKSKPVPAKAKKAATGTGENPPTTKNEPAKARAV